MLLLEPMLLNWEENCTHIKGNTNGGERYLPWCSVEKKYGTTIVQELDFHRNEVAEEAGFLCMRSSI